MCSGCLAMQRPPFLYLGLHVQESHMSITNIALILVLFHYLLVRYPPMNTIARLTPAMTQPFHCTAPCRKKFRSSGALASHRTQSLNCQRRWELHLETRSKIVAAEAIASSSDIVVPPDETPNVASIPEEMGWESPFYISADFSMEDSMEDSLDYSAGSVSVEIEPPQGALRFDDLAADDNEPVAVEEIFKNAGKGYGQQETLFKALHKKQLEKGQGNVYYPFSCYQDFELGVWLQESGLSQTQIDKYLKLEYVRNHSIQVNMVLIISSHALGLLLLRRQPLCTIDSKIFLRHQPIGNPTQLCLNMERYQNLQPSSIATP